ncbi:hypothetical protein H5410_015469, partial [Solanum commersonii]
MHTKRLNLLMQGSIVHSKIQVVTHHYQRISNSQYFLQMQVEAQQRIKCNTHTHKMNIMHDSTHMFARIFQSTIILAYSRSKRSFKACNRVECK